jgi:hypothetical protein
VVHLLGHSSRGGAASLLQRDGWTVITADGRLCAHFEHTVCITPNGARILTEFSPDVYRRIGGPQPLAVAVGR